MVRQPKVPRAGAARFFCRSAAAPRLPIAGTVPIGYEMPMPNDDRDAGGDAGEMSDAIRRLGFSEGTDYYNTGKMGDELGHGHSARSDAGADGARRAAFQYQLRDVPRRAAAGDGITKQYGLATVVTLQDDRIRNMADGEIFNTITNGKNTMMAYGPNVIVAGSLGDHLLSARAAAQPERERGRCAGRASGGFGQTSGNEARADTGGAKK